MRQRPRPKDTLFKPRRFGYGFTPIGPEGIAASVLVFVALGLSPLAVILSAISFIAVLAAFILVAHRHTDYSL